MKRQMREFEIGVKNTEEDADEEIIHIQVDYEKRLQSEQETNSRVTAENSLLRKKFTSFQKEISDYRADLQKTYDNEKKLYKVITNLEKDIAVLKKEVEDRDEAIDDKEKRIYDLKKKNQELDKFKFVLDNKIVEMKHQIEPRDETIRTLNQQIKEMDDEIQGYHDLTQKKEHNIKQLKEKLKTSEALLGQEKETSFLVKLVAERIKDAVYASVQNHGGDIKAMHSDMIQIYQKFCKPDEEALHKRKIQAEHKGDSESNDELTRHRTHLEKTISTLRRKVSKNEETAKSGQGKFMVENSKLLNELNLMRKSNISLMRKLKDYQTIMNSSNPPTTSAKVKEVSGETEKERAAVSLPPIAADTN